MSLPDPPSAPLPFPDRNLWFPVTVRVAWELLMCRVAVRPEVLDDAREHVLRCLDPGCSEAQAEDLAPIYTREYVARVRERQYRRPDVDDELGFEISPTWRDRLCEALDRLGETIFRLHYADGMPLDTLADRLRVDPTTIAVALAGIRETMTLIVSDDGVVVERGCDARIDALIRRLANRAVPGGPGPLGLQSPQGRVHADRCPRASRALRLLNGGHLRLSDLFPPRAGPLVDPGEVEIMALLLHPKAARHRSRLERGVGGPLVPAGPGAWFVEGKDLSVLVNSLTRLAEEGTPARHHLRGSLLRGPARWSRGVLLGPLPTRALEAARARPWSNLDGVCELPAALPPLPSATPWWAASAAIGACAVAAAVWVGHTSGHEPETPVQARFTQVEGGWDVRFDTAELAVVDVVVEEQGTLHVLHRGVRAAKGAWSDGRGGYRLHVPASGVALIASPEGVADIESILVDVASDPLPLPAFARRLSNEHMHVDIAVSGDMTSAL